MTIFINDKPVQILSSKAFSDIQPVQHTVFDCSDLQKLPLILNGHCVFLHTNPKAAESLFKQIYDSKVTNFQSITLVSDDAEGLENTVKEQFKIVKAAGGIIEKEGKFLLMFRLGKWDFPKGKRDEGENSRQTAVREVEEECNIKVRLGEKICTTWHTYSHKGNRILKRTKWYKMDCTDDSQMQPQTEEGIELLEWKKTEELCSCLANSYESIRYVAKHAGLYPA